VRFKHLGEAETREILAPEGQDDLNSFVLEATKDSPSPYFLEGAVIVVNGKVTMRNIILKDGDLVTIFPPMGGG
jgi:molybdopterin converting factor small subunit